jgi:nitrogen regulatory protein P-II 1
VKLITAIVRDSELDGVADAVIGAEARGMTVAEVRGFGQQYGHLTEGSPAARAGLLLRKLRIDVLVGDDAAAAVTDAIAKTVRTGAIGDGKIWICPVDGALRIRTGERDQAAT